MNFKEAYEKLEDLAHGKFFSMDYEITQQNNGIKHQKCSLYIDGGQYYIGNSWDSAFDLLNGGAVDEIEPIDEVEQGEL